MDSGRLLRLLDGLPDESLFKTWALRGGDWSNDQYTQARMINELALSRADGKGYMPNLMKSPMQIEAEDYADSYRDRRHDETLKQLQGEVVDDGDHS